MKDNNIIGKNMKTLRELYKETQEELGDYLGVSHNTISNYENGKRKISIETINRIAEHYMVPVDGLLNDDLKYMETIELKYTPFDNCEKIDMLFPMIPSEKAMKNDYFSHAQKLQKDAYDLIKGKTFKGALQNLYFSFMEYKKAYNDNDISKIVAANMLSIIFASYGIGLLAEPEMKINENIVLFTSKANANIRSSIENYMNEIFCARPNNRLFDDEKKRDETINNMINEISDESSLRDLGEYYLAMNFLFKNISNGIDVNKMVSPVDMMIQYATQRDNNYAKTFLNMCIDSVTNSNNYNI